MKPLLASKAIWLASSACLTLSNLATAQLLFSDNFDSFGAPSDITASGTANGYNIKFSNAAGTENFHAVFGFDYSAITYPLSIPSAPNSTGGSTKGLFLTVNKNASLPQGAASGGSLGAVNLYPVGQSFSGNFSVKYDVWVNWTNLATSTEHAMVGINHSGSLTNRPTAAGSDGLLFAIDGDGGASATSTTVRDFAMFAGQVTGNPLLLRTNNTPFLSLLGTQLDNANPGFTTLFPSKPANGGTPAGSPGLGWVSGEVIQSNNIVTWLLNNTVVASYNNTNSFTSGDIMLGYFDVFGGSIGDTNNFAVFDNISVSVVPEPSVVALLGLGMGFVAWVGARRRA